ncbi:MAG: PfkB family carbohydrate kinase [Candidatus Saganbacteria bacterium]|nr:PfkB family carbohydrate kinase [Candidatus Saganbacteria bacterium]
MNTATVSRYGLNFPENFRWGCVGLGHTRVRLNPGTQAYSHLDPGARLQCIGPTGGEANVAINLADSAGLNTTMLTALVKGDPWYGMIKRGYGAMGVNTDYAKIFDYKPRGPVHGTVFSPLGYGEESPEVTYHVAGEAAAQLGPADFDFDQVFFPGAAFAHTGGIFLTVGVNTPELIINFLESAGKNDVIRSFDLNWRKKLWADNPNQANAQKIYRDIVQRVEILEGNKSDLADALGIEGFQSGMAKKTDPLDPTPHMVMITETVKQFPNLKVVLTNLRHEIDTNHQLWSALAWVNGKFYHAPKKEIFVLDRVGGGDATTAYFLWSMLNGKTEQEAIDIAWAAGALKTATVGDTLKVGPEKVLAKAKAGRSGAAAEIAR